MFRCMTNPLLLDTRPLPFDQVRAEHVVPAIQALLVQARAEVDAIARTTPPLTYESTFGRLEQATLRLSIAMSVVEHLEAVATTPELRTAYGTILPPVSEFWSSIPLNLELYQTLKAFSLTANASSLSETRRRSVHKTLEEFQRSGAELPEVKKARLREIDAQLSQHTTSFSQNVLDGLNRFELFVDETRTTGLPSTAKNMAKEAAERAGKPGYMFTLHAPSSIPVLTFAEDRKLREEVWRASSQRGLTVGNNLELVQAILSLRHEKAELLGFRNFADFVTVDRMAESGERAKAFVADLTERTRAAFDRETRELRTFFVEQLARPGEELEPWDIAFAAEKQRQAVYSFEEEALRPYLSADRALGGAFSLAERLFGVRIEPTALPTWHESVRSYRLIDADGRERGVFYVDLYPRASKREGAWMHGIVAGTSGQPHVALFCLNAQPPTQDTPSLLSFRDLETVFHEFGHLLHHMLSDVEVRSLACTNVAQDFVELPSQILENWCSEKLALDEFACHYQSGEPLPVELVAKLHQARNYRAASAQMRQLGFAAVDLALHTSRPEGSPEQINALAEGILTHYSVTQGKPGSSMIASFGHLFSHPIGYAAGYYSYKWAEVLDADAFTKFRKNGLFDRKTGEEFRHSILSQGDSAPPLDLFRSFMGREPDLTAMLARQGLVTDSQAGA
jgi:oligopeptidase A